MANCLLNNSENMCKFFCRLRKIFLQELLQFLVFEFIGLPGLSRSGRLKSTLQNLWNHFLHVLCVNVASPKQNHFGRLSCIFFDWKAKRMQCLKCSFSHAIVFTNDF